MSKKLLGKMEREFLERLIKADPNRPDDAGSVGHREMRWFLEDLLWKVHSDVTKEEGSNRSKDFYAEFVNERENPHVIGVL